MIEKKASFVHRLNPFCKVKNPVKSEKPFVLVLCFFSPDGNALSMPLACLSSYAKANIANIDVHLVAINEAVGGVEHTVDGFVRRVTQCQPDLIGVSCMAPHWNPLDNYLQALKSGLSHVPVLIGGYQAILDPEQTIAHPAVDYICVGDGEEALVRLITRLKGEEQGNLSGLWESGASGEIIKSAPLLTKDLSRLPMPDYELFEVNESLSGLGLSIFGPRNLFVLPVMTGRGCPYRCSYCCNTSLQEMWQGKERYIRKFDPDRSIAELCRLRDRYGVEYFEFWDELFLADMKFAYYFLERYKKEVRLPFSINSRVEKMDEHFCQTASRAGCHTIWFGIESGSESYRNQRLNRKMSNAQIVTAADNAKKAGIRRLTFNIIGMPFESKENMLETLKLNKSIRPEFFFCFPYLPLKGTPLYKVAEEAGLLLDTLPGSYLHGAREGTLVIKESGGGVTNQEFKEVWSMIKEFQEENNSVGI